MRQRIASWQVYSSTERTNPGNVGDTLSGQSLETVAIRLGRIVPFADPKNANALSAIIGYGIGYAGDPTVREPRIDDFKGRWEALKTLSPDRLDALRKVATVESVGSSTRIEGAKLSDAQVDKLLSNIKMQFFNTRDEQEVAGYAEAMDLVFQAYDDLRLAENHIF